MLSPDSRSLYTSALTPPPGFVFDQALATTYSLDPTTLLMVPLHLALLHGQHEAKTARIALLEGLRQVAERTTIYAERGRMQVPAATHVLYAHLEPMVIEVRAPNGGAFHPKLWLLRFVEVDGSGTVLLRLLVLTRNITADRSWDLSLQLEGQPTGKYLASNRALGELVRDLPSMAVGEVADDRWAQAERLSDELRRTRWELPPDYESVQLHVLGRSKRVWMPPRSKEMVVISPFVRASAIEQLRQTTDRLVAVIARPEELDALPGEVQALAEQWYVLHDAAETEDGEAPESRDTLGLHAKAYVLRCGWDTKLIVGSANATNAALLAGANIEVLAELTGKRSRAKGIDELLGPEGLGPMLVRYAPPVAPVALDEAERAAEKALENARTVIAGINLRIRCERAGDEWNLALQPDQNVGLADIAELRAWPLTVGDDRAVDARALGNGDSVDLGRFACASVTGLVAFELVAANKAGKLRFALNLPLDGMPPERDAAIMRTVLRNRDGFLRYLLLLLGDRDGTSLLNRMLGGRGQSTGAWGLGAGNELPLLEELTRAFSRDPDRLREVGQVVERLRGAGDGEELIPQEFLELWNIFAHALNEEEQ